MPKPISAPDLKAIINDGEELALLVAKLGLERRHQREALRLVECAVEPARQRDDLLGRPLADVLAKHRDGFGRRGGVEAREVKWRMACCVVL